MSPGSDIPVPQKYCLSGIFQDGWCRTNTYLLHFLFLLEPKKVNNFMCKLKQSSAQVVWVLPFYILFSSLQFEGYIRFQMWVHHCTSQCPTIFLVFFFLIFIFIHFFPYHISLCDLTITKIQLRVNIMPSENILQSSFSENIKRGCWRKYWL